MRRCLHPVAAYAHAAPAPRVAFAHIQEPQGAARALALADQGEILVADEGANRICDRQ